jgi:tetratricopeptide (TPR) repeat protein
MKTRSREKQTEHLRRWLAAHRQAVLVAVVCASAAVRIVYFVQLNATPYVFQHRWEETDMSFFDRWARRISAGDWLSDASLHPLHIWHKAVARKFFERAPDRLAAIKAQLPPGGTDDDAARALWDRWYGGKRFHQEPLYPYLVGVTYRLFSPDVRWVFAWQLLLGVLGNVLIYWIARRLWDDLTAAVAALLAVLYAPLLYYEMILVREPLLHFLGLLAVGVLFLARERGSWPWWLAAGFAAGAAVLGKSTFVLFFAGALFLLVLEKRKATGSLWRTLPACVIGFGIALSPAVARNIAVGVSPLALSSVNAQTFIQANTSSFDPARCNWLDIDSFLPVMAKSEGSFGPTVAETLKTHESVPAFGLLLLKKFLALWHWLELPNNSSFYFYRLNAGILRILPFTFLLVGPLALVGLVLALPRAGAVAPLYLLVLTHLVPLVLTFSLSRYRVPLAGALLPFAALTVVRLVEWLERRTAPDVAKAGLTAAGLAVISLFVTMNPHRVAVDPIRQADYDGLEKWYRENEGVEGERRYLLRVVKVYPQAAQAFSRLGDIAVTGADYRLAADYYEQSLRVDPNQVNCYTALVAACAMGRQYERALPAIATGLKRFPYDPMLRANAAFVYEKLGRWQDAHRLRAPIDSATPKK